MIFLQRKKPGIALFLLMNYLSKMIFILKTSALKRNYQIIMIVFGLLSAYAAMNSFVMAVSICAGLLMILHEYEQPQCLSLEYHHGHWILENNTDDVMEATLLRTSIIFRHVMILHFEHNKKQKKIVVVFSDQMEIEHYRALRRCVKMRRKM